MTRHQANHRGLNRARNIFFVVHIPDSYWDKKYPEETFTSDTERRALIEADIQLMEDKFTTAENAKKALITHFSAEIGEASQWKIDVLQPKFSEENFVTSTAADTQISIAQGINPDLLIKVS